MAETTVATSERTGSGAWPAVFRHRWKVLVVAVVLAVVGYVGAAALLKPSYSATATITLGKDRPFDPTATGNNAAQLGDPAQWASLQAAVVKSTTVLDSAAPQVPEAERALFREVLTVTAVPDTNQVTVTAAAPSAADAAATANAVANAYQAVMTNQVATARDNAIAAVSTTSDKQQITLAATTYGSGVSGIDPAIVPTQAARRTRGSSGWPAAWSGCSPRPRRSRGGRT